jgi:hypothetical protein
MSSKTDSAAPRSVRLGLLAVLLVAVAVRAPGLGGWSLWEDEETSVHFSQRPDKPFPASFPIFFRLLEGVYAATGVDVLPGRVLCAALGVLGIALTYFGFARAYSRPVAVVAAVLVALSAGHVFWSQSVRYYILLFAFQALSLYWFIDGFERGRAWALVLSNIALALGLWTHFSGALLMPVFVGYLILALLRRETGGGYNAKGYAAFGIPFLVVSALFAWQFVKFKANLGSLVVGATNPVRLLAQVVIYFGPGTVALAALAPLVVPGWWRDRRFVFLLVTALVPVLELIVIAVLNLTIVTWYYAFFALLGFAGLAALAVTSLADRGRRAAAGGLLALAVLASVPLVAAYHLVLFGDRPRWREAAEFVRAAAPFDPAAATNPPVYANVPGVVAFYLGVPPGETMGHPFVRELVPFEKGPPAGWYVVEDRVLRPEYRQWLAARCEQKARFECKLGPIDRTLTVYLHR